MELTEKIREAASLVEIASQYTTLKKRGRKWVGLCPFHTEKTPSFTVDEDKQLYHCFGCGAGGDIFTMVMEKENFNFPEAVKYLAERYHIPMPQKQEGSPGEIKLEEKLFKINEMALAFFQDSLARSQEGRKALEYLKKRGITPETIKELKIGYAPNTWNSLCDFLRAKKVPYSFIEKAGLALPGKRAGEYYDRFRGRVIFPIFSLSGKTVGFGGRTLFNVDPKYLNSPETPIYSKGRMLYGLNLTKGAIRDRGYMIMVEGYMDFTALYQAGVKNVAASLGTSLTPYQAGLAMRFASRLVLNYDPDPAGWTAAARAVPICLEKGLNVAVMKLPQGVDPDAYINEHGQEAYLAQVGKATSGLGFYIDSLAGQADISIPEEKSKVVKAVVKELEKIADPVTRNEYLSEAARHLRTGEEILRQLLGGPQGVARHERPEEPISFCPAEKRLFQIMVQDRNMASELVSSCETDIFRGLKSEPAFRFIFQSAREGKSWDLLELKNALPAELFSQLTRALLEKSEPGSIAEARSCLTAVQNIFFRNKLKEIQREIGRLGKDGDQEKMSALQVELNRITLQQMNLNEERDMPPEKMPAH